jgi:hypothetical protein
MKVMKAYVVRRLSVKVARKFPEWDELKTHCTGMPVTAVRDCFILEFTNILTGDVPSYVCLGEVVVYVHLVELNLACLQMFNLFENWLYVFDLFGN